jgi:hypothetical protein
MAIHYVATDGSGDFTTIAQVNAHTFVAGDQVLFRKGDTWTGTTALNINHSGALGNPIIYSSYGSGDLPKFNFLASVPGWSTAGNWTQNGNIWRITVSLGSGDKRLWLSGVEAQKCSTATVTASLKWYYSGTILYVYSATNPASAFSNIQFIDAQSCIQAASTNADYITISNLDLQGAYYIIDCSGTKGWTIENCNIGWNGNVAIHSWANGTTRGSTDDLIIRNNTIDSGDRFVDAYMLNNTFEAIEQRDGANNWDIYGNTISNWTHGALGLYEYTAGYVHINVKYHDNIITAKDIDYGYALVYNSKPNLGTCTGNEMYNNYIYSMATDAIQINGDGLKIYNNIVDTVRWSSYESAANPCGLFMQSYSGLCCDNLIYNNVFMNCYAYGIRIDYYNADTKRNVIANNIFLNNGTYDLYVDDGGTRITTNTYKNNIFYKSASTNRIYYYFGGGAMSVSTFNTKNGGNSDTITNNLQSDPTLVDPTNATITLRNYNLLSGSPAIATATTTLTPYDKNGNSWKSPSSIGALEYYTIFYVKNGGNDNLDGKSDTTAWATLSKVNGYNFTAGDTVSFKCGSIWRETLIVPRSGSVNNYMKFNSYSTGARPQILGSKIATTWTLQSGNIWKTDITFADPRGSGHLPDIMFMKNAVIQYGNFKANTGLFAAEYDWTWASNYIYVYSTTNPASAYTWVEVPQNDYGINVNSKEYISIQGLEFHYQVFSCIYSDHTAKTGLTIDSCYLSYIGGSVLINNDCTGYGINNNYSNLWIKNSEFHHCGRRAISLDIYGNGFTASNCIIEDNYFHDGYHTTGIDIKSGNGYTGTWNGIIVRRNTFWDPANSPWAPYGGTEHMWIETGNAGSIQNVYIYSNKFYNAPIQHACIHTQGYNASVGPTGLYIYNNTFYEHGTPTTGTSSMIWLNYAFTVKIKNNIFYSTKANDNNYSAIMVYEQGGAQDHAQVECNYNLYWSTNSAARILYINGVAYNKTQWATYKSTTGNDANSPTPADPLFVSSVDSHLQVGSPAIHAGVYLSGDVLLDFSSQSFSNPPSLGAYEFGASPVIAVAAFINRWSKI